MPEDIINVKITMPNKDNVIVNRISMINIVKVMLHPEHKLVFDFVDTLMEHRISEILTLDGRVRFECTEEEVTDDKEVNFQH